MSRLVEV
jgi:hypothetical protein